MLALVLLAQAGCSGLAGGDPQSVRAPKTELIENNFGFDIHNALQDWPSVSFGYWRLWDAGVDWARVEPSPSVFDFSLLDRYVALAAQHNVKIVYVLGNTPNWAAQDPTAVGTEGLLGATSPPQQTQDWQNFVQTVVNRYKGRIQAYEIWNESNLSGYWAGTPDEMFQLTQIAYNTIKQIDSAAVVLAPSVVAHSGIDWMSNFLSNGGSQVTDAVAYHLYDTATAPEDAVPMYQQVISIAEQSGKTIWDTEVGWGPWGTFNDTQSASFLARTLILQSAAGATHIMWYAWDDRGPWVHLFLVRSDLHTPTPAATAFGQVESWLVNSMLSCSRQPDDTWECPLVTSDGKHKYIVWNRSGSQSFSVPSTWNVSHFRDLQGNQQRIVGGQLQINSSPVLLE